MLYIILLQNIAGLFSVGYQFYSRTAG